MRRALVLGSSLCLLLSTGALADVGVGDKAPKLSAGSWFNLPQGMSRISMKDLKGQVVLLDFWATW